jgi:hypothetical protein
MQDGATAHTATYSMNGLNEVFEDVLISRGLWPARSPRLKSLRFLSVGKSKRQSVLK